MATVTSGNYVNDDDACQNVHFDDVGIVKTTQGVDGPVESDGTFKYVLTVTNHGTRAATNVKVSDPVPGRLTVTGIDFANAPGWSNDHLPLFVGEGNTVDLTGPASFGVGATAEIVLTVKVNPVPVPEIPNLNEGDPVPTPALPQSTLVNQACVDADVDSDPSNDCDSVTVETKDIAAIVYTRCVGDAPLIGFVVAKTPNLAALPVDFTWTPNFPQSGTAPANVEKQYPGGTATVSDEFAWVGTAFTPSGISIDYPGWRGLTAADYAPGGGYYIPGTTDVMTPADEEEMIFNGLIFDPSELDYAWRNTTTVVLSVNPSMTFTVEYPDATPECFVARHTEVQIEKTASVEKTDPGKSFTYTLAAANVSDDSAADGVVVTDTIPADLKITDVSWTGKGDANVFPNWSTCAVSGQNGAGYGGTLTCELFGPLQPAGSGLGASAAPTITLSATVNASSKASVITNVGVVDYYTFGDPTDTGRDADDAVVLLSGLPATGGSALTPLILLGFLALLGGTMTVFMIRRRRGDPKPQL
ncbi:LPXTG cell wall anchor domain-containing protein [Microbacterium sp. Root61]|uniref:LPXTG cell wall anchor domain-containing protein n=1 Tax=Microbacterium sp. Root61 TaxID=1736570 RepID=UPI001F42EB34|nr:LPXTG cell wall anchor domain-containing protein [Microbacterium sp. Root61]